jgi:phosphate transport system protein
MLPKYQNKISEIRQMIIAIIEQIAQSSQLTLNAFESCDEEQFNKAKTQLDTLQQQANALDNEIIKTFALFGPEAHELRLMVAYLKMNGEVVRIGEGVVKYTRRMFEHCKSELDLTPLRPSIIMLHKSTINSLGHILKCFHEISVCDTNEMYRKVMVEESKNDDIFAVLEKDIMQQITRGDDISLEYVKILGTIRKLERSCDRSVNIAKLLVFAEKGGEIQIYE